jgi:hypothetical protein
MLMKGIDGPDVLASFVSLPPLPAKVQTFIDSFDEYGAGSDTPKSNSLSTNTIADDTHLATRLTNEEPICIKVHLCAQAYHASLHWAK